MRNEILDKAGSSRDIVSRVQNEITNAKKKENAKKLKTKLKKMGVEKAPEQYSQQMYNGKWKTVIEINLTDDVPDEIELPLIPLHGLRHTAATLLIANGVDVRTVSGRLGHANTSTTLNIYSHALEEFDRKAADVLEQVLTFKKA